MDDRITILDGPPPPPRRRSPALVAVLAIAAVVLATSPAGVDRLTPATTVAPPPVAEPPRPTHSDDPAVVAPDLDRVRVAIAGSEAVWVGDGTTVPLEGDAPSLDIGGAYAATLADRDGRSGVLHITPLAEPGPTVAFLPVRDVRDVTWHPTRAGRLAALGVDDEGNTVLVTATMVLGRLSPIVIALPDLAGAITVEWQLEGWSDHGFVMHRVGIFLGVRRVPEVVTLDPDGVEIAAQRGVSALAMRPDGAVAVRMAPAGTGVPVVVTGIDLEPLDAAPRLGDDTIRVRWLPAGGLVVWDDTGITARTATGIPYRRLESWPLAVSQDGSLVAVRGSAPDELAVVELATGEMHTVQAPAPILAAALVARGRTIAP